MAYSKESKLRGLLEIGCPSSTCAEKTWNILAKELILQ